MSDVLDQFDKVIQRFENMSRASFAAVKREMEAFGPMLVNYIRSAKLSGQVLGYRSGNLWRSLEPRTTQQGAETRTEVGIWPGSPGFAYANIHEHGGTVSIPPYVGSVMRFRAKSGDLVFTRHRRAYTVNMPERSYLRSGLREMLPTIMARLQIAGSKE